MKELLTEDNKGNEGGGHSGADLRFHAFCFAQNRMKEAEGSGIRNGSNPSASLPSVNPIRSPMHRCFLQKETKGTKDGVTSEFWNGFNPSTSFPSFSSVNPFQFALLA